MTPMNTRTLKTIAYNCSIRLGQPRRLKPCYSTVLLRLKIYFSAVANRNDLFYFLKTNFLYPKKFQKRPAALPHKAAAVVI